MNVETAAIETSEKSDAYIKERKNKQMPLRGIEGVTLNNRDYKNNYIRFI